jgi:hypothetical protein
MQMLSVDTSAGTAICDAPSRIACLISLPSIQISIGVFDLDGGVVDQDSDGQRQSAQGHDVDGLVRERSAPGWTSESTAEWKPR